MNIEQRAVLALEAYNAMLDETDSFEGDVGADLAYLMGEVLKGDKFQAWLGLNDEFMRALVGRFGSGHELWKHVELTFPDVVQAKILRGAIGNLDEEDFPLAGAWIEMLKKGEK